MSLRVIPPVQAGMPKPVATSLPLPATCAPNGVNTLVPSLAASLAGTLACEAADIASTSAAAVPTTLILFSMVSLRCFPVGHVAACPIIVIGVYFRMRISVLATHYHDRFVCCCSHYPRTP